MAAPGPQMQTPSLPNLKDPETRRQMQAQRSMRIIYAGKEGEEEHPYNFMCKYPGCGQAMVRRRNFTGDPNHLDFVCGWAGYDKDGKPVHPQPTEAPVEE